VSGCYKVCLREKGSGILGALWKGKVGERVYDRFVQFRKENLGALKCPETKNELRGLPPRVHKIPTDIENCCQALL
jgi:hypothetical protein